MFMLNDKLLPLDTPFTVGEGDEAIQYPANWLRLSTLEEKTAIGITEVADPETYDDRFYWGVGNPKQLEDETVTPEGQTEPITTKGLKSQWIAQHKNTANTLLQPSDWMVLRQLSRGVGISHIYEDYRTAVIDECTRLETAINACTSVEELAAIQPSWPKLES
jgi:hypothetical protein